MLLGKHESKILEVEGLRRRYKAFRCGYGVEETGVRGCRQLVRSDMPIHPDLNTVAKIPNARKMQKTSKLNTPQSKISGSLRTSS
jgi:glutamine synthetase